MNLPNDASRDDREQDGAKRRIGVPSVGSLLLAGLLLLGLWAGLWAHRVRAQIALIDEINQTPLPVVVGGVVEIRRNANVEVDRVGPEGLHLWVKDEWLRGIAPITRINWTEAGDDDLRRLAPHRRLTNVKLGARITDAGLETLSGFDRLESVFLQDASGVTREGLRNLSSLPRLDHLVLSNMPQLTDEDLEPLCGMRQLHSLFLSGPEITDEGLDRLVRNLDLESLSLDSPRVRGEGLRRLSGTTSVEWLSLSGTKVDDDALRHFAGLTSLTHLWLDRTDVTDAGLKHLARCSSLRHLSLDGTRVTTEGLKALSGIPGLVVPPLNPPESRPE